MVQKFSGTRGLVGRKVGLVPEGLDANVECMYGVFPLVPLP